MAVANITLVFNITSQTVVASTGSSAPVSLPVVTVGDTYNLRIAVVESSGSGVASVQSVLDPSGLSLKVGIGILGGTPDVLTTTFTPSGSFLIGTLDCTTAAFAAKVAAATPLYFEAELGESGLYSTIFQSLITCRNQVIPTTATSPTPGDEFLSRAECLALFAQFINTAGRTITLTSADGQRTVTLGCNTDGSFDTIAG